MTMKVRDLIERLLEFDLDKPVEIDGGIRNMGIANHYMVYENPQTGAEEGLCWHHTDTIPVYLVATNMAGFIRVPVNKPEWIRPVFKNKFEQCLNLWKGGNEHEKGN